ncbi:MAG: AbrB/MazE/SpoVT family DNA-binding domain-containing protein [Thermofilaceae archaeon]
MPRYSNERMLKSYGNVAKIREDRGQFMVTIPRALALSLGLRRGDLVEFVVTGREELLVRILRKEEPYRSS